MIEEEIVALIKSSNTTLAKYQKKLKEIKQEIEEAEDALKNARKHEEQFYASIERRKGKSSGIFSGINQMKFLSGFCSQLNELLSGNSFKSTESSIQHMIQTIKNRIAELSDEYDKYVDLIRKTNYLLSNYENDLVKCRNEMNEVN